MLGITVLAVGTAIFGLAAPAMAGGQYCTASNGNFSACTDVNGENSAINWASANATSSTAITEEVHVELVISSAKLISCRRDNSRHISSFLL
jgi:hypothetical protein